MLNASIGLYFCGFLEVTIYNNKDKIILVAGNWEKINSDGHYMALISSKKQISVIKR